MDGWKRETITIATFEDGKVWKIKEADAWCKSGLAVHRSRTKNGWRITHIHSGYRFPAAHFILKRKQKALEVAERLLKVTDWTQSRTKLMRPASKWREIGNKVSAVSNDQ